MKNDWLKSAKSSTTGIEKLIDRSFLGSRGAKYRLISARERLKSLDHPLFYYLEVRGKVLGNITFCNRLNSGVSENYIRYFAFDPGFQQTKKRSDSNSNKKSKIRTLFNQLLDKDIYEKNDKYCYYAFVDQQNWKSLSMGETFGFQKIGKFSTTSFSRLNPKRRMEIKELTGSELDDYKLQLKHQYQKYNFFHPVNTDKGKVFDYLENGKMILAATFYPTDWEIKSLPGNNGELKMKILGKLPLLSRFFPNRIMSFLGMEGLICQQPHLINKFFESVLNQNDEKIIFIWADSQCEIVSSIKPFLKNGILSRFSKQEEANIIVKHNLNPDIYNQNPSYISAYDIS